MMDLDKYLKMSKSKYAKDSNQKLLRMRLKDLTGSQYRLH